MKFTTRPFSGKHLRKYIAGQRVNEKSQSTSDFMLKNRNGILLKGRSYLDRIANTLRNDANTLKGVSSSLKMIERRRRTMEDRESKRNIIQEFNEAKKNFERAHQQAFSDQVVLLLDVVLDVTILLC